MNNCNSIDMEMFNVKLANTTSVGSTEEERGGGEDIVQKINNNLYFESFIM